MIEIEHFRIQTKVRVITPPYSVPPQVRIWPGAPEQRPCCRQGAEVFAAR